MNDNLSFEEVKYHVSDIEEIKENQISNVGIILIGNKSDLIPKKNKRKSTTLGEKQGKILIEKREIPYFECSTIESSNIEKSFLNIIQQIKKNRMIK